MKNVAEIEKAFTEIFLKVFRIKDFILDLKEILKLLEVDKLVIIVDDFSEIDDQSIKTFVDVILAPLNNWSDEFIKFKVAAYPNRIYYGRIDKGKIDIVDLDFFNLYSELGRDVMEEKAVDFTKRLIQKRIEHFTSQSVDYFFEVSRKDRFRLEDYYELIFQISMNVPRIIGYILFYCYERTVISGKPITKTSLKDAASRYYEKNIECFFDATTYSMMSIDEKISILQLKELLHKIVTALIDIRRRISSGELSGGEYGSGKPFTSHFYFLPAYEQFIKTLELNFFVSKYIELSDKDGGKQSIYCLNYGLCQKENLRWGKPSGTQYRKYFVARAFNFNNLVHDFLKKSKRIMCVNPSCSSIFPFERLDFFEFNKMKCPECQSPVRVSSMSEEIKRELEKIDKSKLLPALELSIIYEISNSSRELRAKEIAEELDCSYQLIGRKAKKLDEEKSLVIRLGESGKRTYMLTDKAIDDYFSEP